jgi:hypothetical protein
MMCVCFLCGLLEGMPALLERAAASTAERAGLPVSEQPNAADASRKLMREALW